MRDTSFVIGDGFDWGGEGDLVSNLVVQNNGDVVVGGYFGLYD
jgi:hypothetical protein